MSYQHLASQAVSPAEPRSDESGEPVDFDLACFDCGYNLRTLPRNARCPECNALVEESLRLGGRRPTSFWTWPPLVAFAVAGVAITLVVYAETLHYSEVGVSGFRRFCWRSQEELAWTSIIFLAGGITTGLTIQRIRQREFGFRDAITLGLMCVANLCAIGLTLTSASVAALTGRMYGKYMWLGVLLSAGALTLAVWLRLFAAAVSPVPGSALSRGTAIVCLTFLTGFLIAAGLLWWLVSNTVWC